MSDFISEILGLFGLGGPQKPINRINRPSGPTPQPGTTPITASRHGKPRPRPVQAHPLDRFFELGHRSLRYLKSDSTNKALAGVLIRKGFLYATDGHRAFIARVNVPSLDGAIIPAEFFKMQRYTGPLRSIGLTPDRQQLVINGAVSPGPLIDATYPNIEEAIPKRFLHELRFDKRELITAVASALSLADKKALIVFDARTAGRVIINAQTPGAIRQTVAVVGTPVPEPFGLDGRYLQTILRDISGETVVLRMNNSIGAMIFEGEEKEIRLLLMPMRIRAEEESLRQAA